MTTHQPKPNFAPLDIHFLGSSSAAESQATPYAGAVFGAGLDLTESFRAGAHGGPSAVRFMSDSLELYSPYQDATLEDVSVLDLGDLSLGGLPMDPALALMADAMAYAASVARLGVMIGGEHTGSLAGYRGVKRVYPDALLIMADAHLDIREQYEGQRLSHASWLYQAGEEFGFENLFQVGLRSGEQAEWRRSRDRTAYSTMELALSPAARRKLESRPVYLSIDIDVLDPAHAPGTGCPEPGGVTFRELHAFLLGLSGVHVVGMDVMEVSPNLDESNITAAAGAKLIREAVLLFGRD